MRPYIMYTMVGLMAWLMGAMPIVITWAYVKGYI